MTMTSAPESLFDSFRRAEMLVARSRPLDALQALLPVLAHRLELDPADHYARFALGKALQRQRRLAEAHAQYKMAAAMDPRPEYQEALGEVRARMAFGADD